MRYKMHPILVVNLFFLTTLTLHAQDKIRTVEHGRFKHDNEPIQIVSRALGEKPFIDDRRVMGDQDWLSQLTLGIRNISDKNIISFDLDLVIERQGEVLMGIPISFRALAKAEPDDDETSKEIKKQKLMRPGEIVKVKVKGRVLSLFGNELKKSGMEDVERVTLDIRFVYFDDGTRWVMGREGSYAIHESKFPFFTLTQRLSLFSKFFPPDLECTSNRQLALVFPASSRIFLFNVNVMLSPAPPPTCVWLVNEEVQRRNCTESCEGDDAFCKYEDFEAATYATDPGGGALKGFMRSEPYMCQQSPIDPTPPSCSTCNSFTHNVFRADSQCGIPGSCGESATWGCASGFVDINGVCKRSLTYQQSCEYGYDEFSCSCNPSPPSPPSCPYCFIDSDCDAGCPTMHYWCDTLTYLCYPMTPVLIDPSGNGVDLTGPENGVLFDLNGNGEPDRISWTSPESDDGWLVLDRNNNGLIDDGSELFGNITVQPIPPQKVEKNGFLALAVFDQPSNAGNGDGKIDAQDSIYLNLRLWQDRNHNGISESDELSSLPALGITSLDLTYKESGRRDRFGNRFRYRAKVYGTQAAQLGRWAYDIILRKGPSGNRFVPTNYEAKVVWPTNN